MSIQEKTKEEKEVEKAALITCYNAIINRNNGLITSMFLDTLNMLRNSSKKSLEQISELENYVELILEEEKWDDKQITN